MAVRIARSLDTLRSQINARWPNRKKGSDGWIGDTAHAARKSDHNPNSVGVVQALDITHDPATGPDAGKLAEALVAGRDVRIKYVISNRRIASSYPTGGVAAWAWRPYSGTNAHEKHCHISVVDVPTGYDDPRQWDLSKFGVAPAAPPVPASSGQRLKMAQLILGYEAKRNSEGHIAVYTAADGSREIGGVNETYHPDKFAALKALFDAGRHAEVEAGVCDYILDYTALAATWTNDPAIEFYLRDTMFNRGPTGCAKILQRAVGVPVDGIVGTQTLAAMKLFPTDELLTRLRVAREAYERETYGRGPGTPLWAGLLNRWNNAQRDAKQFESLLSDTTSTVVIAGGAAAGTAAAGAAAASGFDWHVALPIGIMVLAGALLIVFLIRRRR